jgi:hypothetical protein
MSTVRVQVDGDLPGVVAQAVAGDEAAFARIIQAHHDDMTRVCFVICGDLDVADEAVQVAWPIAWRKLGSLREPERLRAWLVSIAANGQDALLWDPNTAIASTLPAPLAIRGGHTATLLDDRRVLVVGARWPTDPGVPLPLGAELVDPSALPSPADVRGHN